MLSGRSALARWRSHDAARVDYDKRCLSKTRSHSHGVAGRHPVGWALFVAARRGARWRDLVGLAICPSVSTEAQPVLGAWLVGALSGGGSNPGSPHTLNSGSGSLQLRPLRTTRAGEGPQDGPGFTGNPWCLSERRLRSLGRAHSPRMCSVPLCYLVRVAIDPHTSSCHKHSYRVDPMGFTHCETLCAAAPQLGGGTPAGRAPAGPPDGGSCASTRRGTVGRTSGPTRAPAFGRSTPRVASWGIEPSGGGPVAHARWGAARLGPGRPPFSPLVRGRGSSAGRDRSRPDGDARRGTVVDWFWLGEPRASNRGGPPPSRPRIETMREGGSEPGVSVGSSELLCSAGRDRGPSLALSGDARLALVKKGKLLDLPCGWVPRHSSGPRYTFQGWPVSPALICLPRSCYPHTEGCASLASLTLGATCALVRVVSFAT